MLHRFAGIAGIAGIRGCVPGGLILSTGAVNWSSWEGFFDYFLTFFWSSWECFGVTWDSLVAHRRSVLSGYFLKKTLNKFQKIVGFWRCCSGRGWLSEACRSILPQLFFRKLPYGMKLQKMGRRDIIIFPIFFSFPFKGLYINSL